VRMVLEGVVTAVDGTDVRVEADTICVHGDSPAAASLALVIRSSLEAVGVRVVPLRGADSGGPN